MALEKVLLPGLAGSEELAVVPRVHLFGGKSVSGIVPVGEQELFDLLSAHMEFRIRTEELERDERVKQVACYFLVRSGDRYLTAVRTVKEGDNRLHGARLIGFGGHVRSKDIKGKMKDWMQREFLEEVAAEEVLGINLLGLINHDGYEDNGLHRVHFGLLLEVETAGKVGVSPEEKDVMADEELLTIEELGAKREEMELWSKFVLDYLLAKQSKTDK